MSVYTTTISLCPQCARESIAGYEERRDGIWLSGSCADHGRFAEKVESDAASFKWAYEQDYIRTHDHLALPVTYRCNLTCKYCYSLSNSGLRLPEDRTIKELAGIFKQFGGNLTLLGGEPTVREDLPRLISEAKRAHAHRKVSIGSNGGKLANIDYLRGLKEAGLDFVFLSLNHADYDGRAVRENKVKALDNCHKLRLPVWLQQTVDDVAQVDSLIMLLKKYKHVVFSATVRSVRPFGLRYPQSQVFVSDILKYLGREHDFSKGASPFNRYIRLYGRPIKVCFWVNDVKRVDPVDSAYITSDNRWTSFHRGIKVDEALIKAGCRRAEATKTNQLP